MKFFNLKFSIFKQDQESGATLIIALILLASVTFISFALSTVIIREMKAARLILETEPALSGANSGGEVALYRFQRSFGGSGSQGSLPQSNASYTVATDFYDDSYDFTVQANEILKISLYDAENIANVQPGYSSVRVANTTGQPIKANVYSWATPSAPLCVFNSIPAGNNSICSNLNAGADQRYIVEVERQGAGSATGQLTALGVGGEVKGIPAAVPQMTVTGSSGGTQRRIQIRLQE